MLIDIVAGIKDLWEKLDISYDDFIRTTEKRHTDMCRENFSNALLDKAIFILENTKAGTVHLVKRILTSVNLNDGQLPGLWQTC